LDKHLGMFVIIACQNPTCIVRNYDRSSVVTDDRGSKPKIFEMESVNPAIAAAAAAMTKK